MSSRIDVPGGSGGREMFGDPSHPGVLSSSGRPSLSPPVVLNSVLAVPDGTTPVLRSACS